jgi:FkbM family methyltransferase
VPGLSTARKLSIARLLRRLVGAALMFRRGSLREMVCTRHQVRWSLDLDEGVQLALYLGVYERSTRRALARLARPDAIVLDVGANIGAQALPLARRLDAGGYVIAVEPADDAVARLRANRALNPEIADRLTVVHRALGAPGDAAERTYYAAWPLAPAAGSHPVHLGAPQRSTATSTTVDALMEELHLPRVDLIKLDVDGHELPVLRGATAALTRHHPTVVLELCPYLLEERGEALAELTRLFFDLGYHLYDERTFRPLPTDADELLRTIPAGGSINVLASIRPPDVQ